MTVARTIVAIVVALVALLAGVQPAVAGSSTASTQTFTIVNSGTVGITLTGTTGTGSFAAPAPPRIAPGQAQRYELVVSAGRPGWDALGLIFAFDAAEPVTDGIPYEILGRELLITLDPSPRAARHVTWTLRDLVHHGAVQPQPWDPTCETRGDFEIAVRAPQQYSFILAVEPQSLYPTAATRMSATGDFLTPPPPVLVPGSTLQQAFVTVPWNPAVATSVRYQVVRGDVLGGGRSVTLTARNGTLGFQTEARLGFSSTISLVWGLVTLGIDPPL